MPHRGPHVVSTPDGQGRSSLGWTVGVGIGTFGLVAGAAIVVPDGTSSTLLGLLSRLLVLVLIPCPVPSSPDVGGLHPGPLGRERYFSKTTLLVLAAANILRIQLTMMI
eukprot:TRINITY_DN0_c93_g1_i2.p1 TRINITY_DN0_c93_g1~~TRINITY_DN0_c93_g1_i2.p1  ORF type:complete len:109 (-),score=4.41 TRINITY_DN0_c93_g1_i2:24-350(-)